MATERETLLNEVRGLRVAVLDLAGKVDEKVPREELKRRLRRTALLVLAIAVAVILLAVTVNRLTLLQSRDDFSEAITTCFLRPAAITDAQAAACDRRFSEDHEYRQLQEQSKAATKNFASLLKWAKENGWKPPAP